MKPNDNGTAGSVLQTSSGTTNNSNVSTTAGSLTNGGTAGNKSNADLSLSLQQTGSSRTASREDDDQQQVDSDDANQQNPGKMFIGGLSWNTTAEGLRDYFSKFGEVNECIVMRDPNTKRARGFGFITFVDPVSVEKVLACDGHELDGKSIDPKVAFPKRHQPKMVVRTKKVFIGGLSSNSTLEDIKTYFSQFGKIEDAMLMFDKSTQRHRGFGFIMFESEEVSEKVCEIHFHEVPPSGKMVECKKAQPKEVMLPIQLNKTRAAATRNLYGLSPEQLLAYASYAQPRMPYASGSLLYPGLFNGFSQSFGMTQSGRSSVSVNNTAGGSSGMVNPRDLAAVQAAAQQQAVYEAAVAYANSMNEFGGFHGHQQTIGNNYNNKM
jgi:RNA recognition motif-containing protein